MPQPTQLSRRAFLAATTAAPAAVLLSGCGGSANNSSPNTTSAPTRVAQSKQIGPFLFDIRVPTATATHDETVEITTTLTNTSNATAHLTSPWGGPISVVEVLQNGTVVNTFGQGIAGAIIERTFAPGQVEVRRHLWDAYPGDRLGDFQLRGYLTTYNVNDVEYFGEPDRSLLQTPPLDVVVRPSVRAPQPPTRVANVSFGPFRAEVVLPTTRFVRADLGREPFVELTTRLLTTEAEPQKYRAQFYGAMRIYINRVGDPNSIRILDHERVFPLEEVTVRPGEPNRFGIAWNLTDARFDPIPPGEYEVRAFAAFTSINGQPVGDNTSNQRLSQPVRFTIA